MEATDEGPDSRHIHAPWTAEEAAALNRYQRQGRMHPFTCGRRGEPGHVQRPDEDLGQLVATQAGWECRDCDYTQDWAWRFMLEDRPWQIPWLES